MTIFCDHTYKLNCVFLWENHKNLFFNTQKLDHDGNKMWAPIPWDNTFQLVQPNFKKQKRIFVQCSFVVKKWALTHRIIHKSIGSARSQFLGIVHDSVFYPQRPQLHRFRWLTPHFEGNHNIFLSDIVLLKTQKFKIFMNMPT